MCAWQFGESWDCYTAAPTGETAGYWETPGFNMTAPVAGRFAGSRAASWSSPSTTPSLIKSSGQNDALHHINLAYTQSTAVTGTSLNVWIQLRDGTTPQCSIVIRSDGAILLTSGIQTGTVLATYTGAVTTFATWYSFEIEVFISATGGYMNVRKNGNTVNDFTSATNLNTRPGTANNYANAIALGSSLGGQVPSLDDLYWRSDASSLPWWGDIRCYTRAPASDASVQFSRTTPLPQVFFNGAVSITPGANQAKYMPFTPTMSGNMSEVAFLQSTGIPTTANMKCALYATNPGTPPTPSTLLATATAVVNGASIGAGGAILFTFSPPIAVVAGTTYAAGIDFDATVGNLQGLTSSNSATVNTQTYASFPVNNPSGLTASSSPFRVVITLAPASNYMVVNEAQQDTTTSYVYDSVVGHADLYGIAPIASTPLTTFAVTTRAYAIKSDAGTRTMAVQLKSGSSTVASPTVVLTPSNWQWAWRHDTTNPATSLPWTAVEVNNATIGPLVVA